jgi:hypothetical protein
MNVAYIDGSLLIRRSYLEAKINTTDTVKLLDDLGFTIHPTKSALEPTQVIEFLGFTIDSRTMRINLTERKAIDIYKNALFASCNCKDAYYSIRVRRINKLSSI